MPTKGTWLDALKLLKFGTATSYTQFESDGTLVSTGDATTWNDIIMPALNLKPGASAPAFAAFQDGVYAYRMDDSKTDELHGAAELPHDYKEGSALEIHVHWSPSTTNTGAVSFTFEYTIANSGGTFGTTVPVTNTQAGSGTANTHQRFAIGAMVGTNRKIGDVIAFRLYRNGTTDAFTGNAFVHSIGMHYECDTLGSRLMYTK